MSNGDIFCIVVGVMILAAVVLIHITRENSIMTEEQRQEVWRRNRERLGDLGGWR
jgi:hypothetical protein